MKKYLVLFLLISFSALAQKTFNNYKYIIVPTRFESFKKDNQYRLNTITKMRLNQLGFEAFYTTEQLPENVANERCNFLYVEAENLNGMLQSKMQLVFKDCQGNVVYKSNVGVSIKKDFEESYQEALQDAFGSVAYSFEQPKIAVPVSAKPVESSVKKDEPAATAIAQNLKAEATSAGFLLIDESSSKIEFRLLKTSDPKVFIATRQQIQGVFTQKGNEWFFEYYQNDKMVSEKINVSF